MCYEDKLKNKIENTLKQYVADYSKLKNVQTKWEEPLTAYADANDKMFYKLKDVVSSYHALPKDSLKEAQTVVAYFIPFHESIVKSNIDGRECSKEWARAYLETNQLILDVNTYIKDVLEESGYKAVITPATHNFDEEKLISSWSHRHVAYIAGLGTFGLNNMLITEKGCCGRIGSFITDGKIEPTKRTDKENCLFKHKSICKKCVKKCVNDALKTDEFDRFKCFEMCLYNDKLHSDVEGFTEVCGKCMVNIPCSFVNPVK